MWISACGVGAPAPPPALHTFACMGPMTGFRPRKWDSPLQICLPPRATARPPVFVLSWSLEYASIFHRPFSAEYGSARIKGNCRWQPRHFAYVYVLEIPCVSAEIEQAGKNE
jgi:hypothetical protein